MAANFAGALIVFPSRTGNVAPHHTLNGKNIRSTHEHRTTSQLVSIRAYIRRHFFNICRYEMVLDDVLKLFKPETRQLREYFAFSLDRSRQNTIECRDTICSNNQQLLFSDRVNIA